MKRILPYALLLLGLTAADAFAAAPAGAVPEAEPRETSRRPERRDTPRLERLTCEGLTDPPAIGVAAPRLGWQLRSGRQGDAQRSYRIEVASDSLLLAAGKADLWDSGEVRSPRSVAVPYGGRPLGART